VARDQTDGAVPQGVTAIRLLLAALCVATLGIAYSMARPSAEAAREVGSAPVPVESEPTHEVPPLGRAAKLPALAAPPPRPAPAPAPVEEAPAPSIPVDRPRRSAQPPEASVAPPAVAPSAPVNPPAPPPAPPPPVYEPPPPQPPPPAPEPDVVTFDDSG
jgi:hypothetical protein